MLLKARDTVEYLEPTEPTERDLLVQQVTDQAASGDVAALSGIYDLYHNDLLNLLSYRFQVKNPEDILQDTYENAIKGIEKGQFADQGPGSLRRWVTSIARNKVRDDYRKNQRQPFLPSDPHDMEGDGMFAPANRQDVAEEVTSDLYVEDILNDMPDSDFKTAFMAVVLEGYSYDEYAELTGVAVGTVGSRLNRAKRILRESVES